MPKIQEKIPEHLRPYVFHGVEIRWKDENSQAVGDCPFCGKEGKFSVNPEGLWRCLVCNEGFDKGRAIRGGNAVEFLRMLHRYSYEATPIADYEVLAIDRKLMDASTLVVWNACRSTLTGDWMLPGYNVAGSLCQLYRYIGSPKRRLIPTPTLGHQLFMHSWNPKKGEVRILEGPWDGMVLWEILRQTKVQSASLASTGSESQSLLADVNVLSVPGCETFLEPWFALLKDKQVVWMYDSDHPREHAGRVIPSAGYTGLSRAASIALSNGLPASASYLKWGENGYDPALPSGYDVRDHLASTGTALASRIQRLGELLARTSVFSVELGTDEAGASNREGKDSKAGGNTKELQPKRCSDYKMLQQAWKKAMQWTDGLDRALSCMLASSMSTMCIGDQLWVKIMSPASSGKTSIAEGLAVARKYVKTVDTLRGFTSGYKLPDGTTSDLASELDGMTLLTMDGDTLIQSPNLPNILAEARRLYDGDLDSHFKNGMGKEVGNHRMTWIMQGTSSLRVMDASELGARMLDCVIMEKIDDDLEDEILDRVANRADEDVSRQSKKGEADSQKNAATTEAIRLTAGYVIYLRENAERLLSNVSMCDVEKKLCTRYGKMTAFMRARPSKSQDEVHEREMAGRLVSTMVRLAKCTAAVMNKTEIDSEVIRRTRQIALDTSRGQSLEIVENLYRHPDGLETKSLHHYTGRDESKLRLHLRYLKHLGVVELTPAVEKRGVVSKSLWTLTPRLRKLYSDVMEEE